MPDNNPIAVADLDEQIAFLDAWYTETQTDTQSHRRGLLVSRLVKQIDAALETLTELGARPR